MPMAEKRRSILVSLAIGLGLLVATLMTVAASPLSVAFAADPLPAPVLISPEDGGVVQTAFPTFSWGAVDGAQYYEIQIADDATFNPPIFDSYFTETTTGVWDPLSRGTYYWRVSAIDINWIQGPWSVVGSFTVDIPAVPAPVIISPDDGAVFQAAPLTFSWQTVDGASEYKIQVAPSTTFDPYNIIVDTVVSEATYEIGLMPAGVYYWRVAARSSELGQGLWTEVRSFTIDIPVLQSPTLVGPQNWANLQNDTPAFTWEPVNGAVYYSIQIDNYRSFACNGNPCVYDTTTDPTYMPYNVLPPGIYYWKVAAVDTNGFEGQWSDIRTFRIYPSDLPVSDCPTTSNNSYVSAGVDQYDQDNPVRLATDNADKNIAARGWYKTYSNTYPLEFQDYGAPSDEKMPPQIATLFAPNRVPRFTSANQVIDWNWLPSPEPGYGYYPINNLSVTLLGLEPKSSEELHSPKHGYNLGDPVGKGGAVVLYADPFSITLKFTREDSVATGYTMHITNICTDPNLVALYNSLDNADRNSYGPGSDNTPGDGLPDYFLPGLKQAQVFGTSFLNTEVLVSIRDVGMFLDPRSETEWWQVKK